MELDSIFETIGVVAITGLLSAPYIVGLKDPLSYPTLAKLWGGCGAVIAAVLYAYIKGFESGSPLPAKEISKLIKPLEMIAIVSACQALALLVFDAIYMLPKRLELEREKREQDHQRQTPKDHH